MKRIAVLRCGRLPRFVTWELPNLEELFEEDSLLLRGLEAGGLEGQAVVWNRPDVDWDDYDIALIRSTWDYMDDQAQFLQVLARIEASTCRLFNPLAAVRWNIDKRYLFDLERWGAPIIPTFPAPEVDPGVLRAQFEAQGWRSAVLKPAVGLGAAYSYRVPLHELEATLADLPRQDYLVQPFLDTIVTEGEWSFVYFDRRLSHVLLKRPAPDDYRVQGIYGGTVAIAEPHPQDLLQAEAVLDVLPFDILYCRLDFVRANGRLCVIEVELIEPILCFNLVPESAGRLVDAVRRRLSGEP